MVGQSGLDRPRRIILRMARHLPIKVVLGEITGRYLLVSTAAKYRSSD